MDEVHAEQGRAERQLGYMKAIPDVRSEEEFNDPDGHGAGSLLLPLPALAQRSGAIPSDRPVVVCHSGDLNGAPF